MTGQAAFDPYGVPEKGGKSQAPGTTGTSLGFQAALTDGTTRKVMLGPRQYDPETARFTNPDVFVGGAADVQLGADALTGNRYLFAGANPVAYYEDGHCFAGKEQTSPRIVDQRRLSRLIPVGDGWTLVYYTEDVIRNEKVCVRGGPLGQALDYATGNDITRGGDLGYRNRFRDVEREIALSAPACGQGALVGALASSWTGWVGALKGAVGGCALSGSLAWGVRRDFLTQQQADRIGWSASGYGALRNLFRREALTLWKKMIDRTLVSPR